MSFSSLPRSGSGSNCGGASNQQSPQPSRSIMPRVGSFSSMFWIGEQGPTTIIDNNLNAHLMNDGKNPARSSYGTTSQDFMNTIRFQVVLWSVGQPDVLNGRVNMKFRVTIFWNDTDTPKVIAPSEERSNGATNETPTVWVMSGRQKAYQRKMSPDAVQTIDIPQVSILNVQNFEVIGMPEVALLHKQSKLMRWTCLYRATTLQDDLTVEKFPHDEHELCIRLGILAHRQTGGRWDKKFWKLCLATEEDSQKSIRVPHGLLVDGVKVPGFSYDSNRGLDFNLVPLSFGPKDKSVHDKDFCLEVKLKVKRESGYYDKNIMPLLCALNIVALSVLCLDASNFFKRGLMLLNIAFVQIGIRMSLDNRLPSVGYQIKMQSMLNRFFYSLLFMVIESSFLSLRVDAGLPLKDSRIIDLAIAIALLMSTCYMSYSYYKDILNLRWNYFG
uniref:Neurotransmitter-gated ion-channel ligand-binding domain-containing protein n=2 Tax=Trieres chinensis TaxID=1514140 RepID=A0A7S1ZD64_TRICV|mmetsp:Transcript_22598/g.45766  ORF Transcript_22598/g.45766 Transcript_22598/m.45766 type:complete len:443 (+) Transcript_22598:153-1481(+)